MDNNDWRQRLYVMVFQADTPAGRRFDTALLLIIAIALMIVTLFVIKAIVAKKHAAVIAEITAANKAHYAAK